MKADFKNHVFVISEEELKKIPTVKNSQMKKLQMKFEKYLNSVCL